MSLKKTAFVISFVLLSGIANAQQKRKIIQINIDMLLNARPVTTFNNGTLTSWTKGIDGNGDGDGYLILSASIFQGDKNPHALPDNPLIPATAAHPAIKLHYSNKDSASYQVRYVSGIGEFAFALPHKKYSGLYLSLTSSEGPSQLQVILTYKDGTEAKDFTLPDYYNDIVTNDISLSYLVHDLAKWGKENVMAESDHHNIDVLNIHPDAKRVLTSVSVKKNKPGFLVFWAATGTCILPNHSRQGGLQ
jgi:hypothetical protein